MKFLLDTNFLMIPGRFKVDVFRELEKFGKPELYILDLVVKELEKISRGKGKSSSFARLGLSLLKEKKIRVLESGGKKADPEMLRLSRAGFAVCTQDRKLISGIRKAGGHVAFLRQGKYLEMK